MEEKEKNQLRERLVAGIKAVTADIAAYKQLTKPIAPDNAIGRLTRMEAINSKSVNEAALRKAEETPAMLERAQAKIDLPDFGICRECDEPIPPARLLVMPETTLCVHCAHKLSG